MHPILLDSSNGGLFILLIPAAVIIFYFAFKKEPPSSPPPPPPPGYVHPDAYIEQARKADAAQAQLEREAWLKTTGAKLKAEGHNRSTGTRSGKSFEHIIAFAPDFPFYPDEVRFIGSPIDLIAFENMEDEDKDITIWLVEVKTGSSKLSARQQRIRDAIDNKRVRWMEATALPSGLLILPKGIQ